MAGLFPKQPRKRFRGRFIDKPKIYLLFYTFEKISLEKQTVSAKTIARTKTRTNTKTNTNKNKKQQQAQQQQRQQQQLLIQKQQRQQQRQQQQKQQGQQPR